MGILAKTVNGRLNIATFRVATPAYTLRVADYSVDGPVQDGWVYYNDPDVPRRIPATIDLNASAEVNARILAAFKDMLGPATTGNDIKAWILNKLKRIVMTYEDGETPKDV